MFSLFPLGFLFFVEDVTLGVGKVEGALSA